MKRLVTIIPVFFIFLFCSQGFAQPFELDKKIKPVELLLLDDPDYEGAKGIGVSGIVKDSINYYFVKGHDIFQFIDIYVFANEGNPDLTVELVKDTWSDLAEKKVTTQNNNGIINFKFRTWGDFGLKILPTNETIIYTIVVYASNPVKGFLESPFVEASKENLTNLSSKDAASIEVPDDENSEGLHLWAYIIMGILILVIGLLAGKLLGNKKSVPLILLFVLLSIPETNAQPSGAVGPLEIRGGELPGDENSKRFEEANKRMNDVGGKIAKGVKTLNAAKDLGKWYKDYKSFGECISNYPPPQGPKLPSFCTTSECSSCFRQAREKFNFTRYQFEKLAVIYRCTTTFSEKSLKIGDNVSGIHALSGLAWHEERLKIEASMKEFQQAVDKKRAELFGDLQESLMMLSECEEEHGIPDWYDRFGYMYYDFMETTYRFKK